jgi:16S rRNA (guanine966-N2)-methyltransferase
MRVIAGKLGGRQFESPKGHRTHPMSEKARGALFNALGDIGGLSVFDAFAGSGALSYEAISRGAASVLAIDIDKSAQETIKHNIQELGLSESITLFSGNCLRWSTRNYHKQFDLVLCDPPYDRILIRSIQKIVTHVKVGGMLVLSWPGSLKAEQLISTEQLKVADYGDIQLVFYRRLA